jgi:hypothetical protein
MTVANIDLIKKLPFEEEFSSPLDISDILLICKEYSKLGWQIQLQIENILDNGIEDAIASGLVKQEALPFIKEFLKSIYDNGYLGDSAAQARDCFELISQYQSTHEMVNHNIN